MMKSIAWCCVFIGLVAMASQRAWAVSELRATVEPDGVRFHLAWSGGEAAWNRLVLFIDADESLETGYRGKDASWIMGADLMIQGRTVYRFTGHSPGTWSWSMPVELDSYAGQNAGWVFLPRGLLRFFPQTGIRYKAQRDAWTSPEDGFPASPHDRVEHLELDWSGPGCLGEPETVGAHAQPFPGMDTVRRMEGVRADSAEARAGLRNPERGFRLMQEIGANWAPHVPRQPRQLSEAQVDAYEHLTLFQSYVWLSAYADRPISEGKLARLRAGLEEARQAGRKLLLRFAYERSHVNATYGPSLSRTLGHMDQLAPVVRAYADVIHILQSGFIGAYGEWHNSAEGLHLCPEAKIAYARKFFEVMPLEVVTTVRVPRHKREMLGRADWNDYQLLDSDEAWSGAPESRIGFHNDGFGADFSDGGAWPEFSFYASDGNPEYDMKTEESLFLPVDGELFAYDQGGRIDGRWAATELWKHHYTSLGMWQGNADIERPGAIHSINKWKATEVSRADLADLGLPIARGYFENRDGSPVTRSVFEYIRDHLGYRLEIQNVRYASVMQQGESMGLDVTLVNRGFASPVHPRAVYVVLVSDDGDMFPFATDWDWRRWLPHRPEDARRRPLAYKLSWREPLPDYIPPGTYRLGLWLPDASPVLRHDARFSVRIANDGIDWMEPFGINLVGSIRVPRNDEPGLQAHWTRVEGQLLGYPPLESLAGGYRVVDDAVLDLGSRRPFTIVARIQGQGAPLNGTIVARYNRGVAGQYFLELRDGVPVFSREIHPYMLVGGERLDPRSEHEIVASYDGRRARLFINGLLSDSVWMGPIAPAAPGLPTTVGVGLEQHAHVGAFTGMLKELKIYNAALDQDTRSQGRRVSRPGNPD